MSPETYLDDEYINVNQDMILDGHYQNSDKYKPN
jgi:hypothetical protein